jgi:hypothetical protein
MSALPPKADIDGKLFDVRFVPIADMSVRFTVAPSSALKEGHTSTARASCGRPSLRSPRPHLREYFSPREAGTRRCCNARSIARLLPECRELERVIGQFHGRAGASLDTGKPRCGFRQHAFHEKACGDELGIQTRR